MRLADFILQNMETILQEWEAFAATLPAAAGMSVADRRDHAKQILEAVAADIQTTQTAQAQAEKAKGQVRRDPTAPETAAETHGSLRARHGFDINQLVAEYRALRAAVLRLWLESAPRDVFSFDDMLRFNEGIDQAIAESVAFFNDQVERSRNLLLGMLGHDMRSPLNTIVTTASYLSALNAGREVTEAAKLLIRSGASIQGLVDDLVDFNRTKLGLGINIVVGETDLAEVVGNELEQLRAAHAGRRIELNLSGNTRGEWDAKRLQQLLRNLVSNALKHGIADSTVRVSLQGDGDTVRLEVANDGPRLEQTSLEELFDPLKRGSGSGDGLGLGLFIVREITLAHGGELTVRCQEKETCFCVTLPRRHSR